MSINKKRSGLSWIVLYLLFSCNRQDITVNIEPVTTSQQSTAGQTADLDTPLHKAIVEQKDLALIQNLLKDIPASTPGNQGTTPLHLAVGQGNIALVEMLVAAKADVNAKNTAGVTPLHLAVQQEGLLAIELMKLLAAQQNADINVQDSRGYTPLFYAISKKNLELVQFLLQKGATISIPDLPEASRLGNTAIIQLLLENKANIAARDSYHHTPLILAAKNGHIEAIKLLLASKADLQDKDKVNWTALHWAAYEGHPAVSQFLLDSKADIEANDTWGRTPLHVAATKDQREAIQCLIANQANVYASDYKEKRPYDVVSLADVKKLLALEDNKIVIQEKKTGPRGIGFINILFHSDYGNIGRRMIGYIAPRDTRNLRETSIEMRAMLFQKGAFNLSLPPDRLQSIDGQAYPRLYPTVVQGTELAVFEPLPTEAVVGNASDLQAILKDPRLIVKSIVFKGELENLPAVCEALPQIAHNIEISNLVPALQRAFQNKYERVVRNVRDALAKIGTPEVIRGLLTVLENEDRQLRNNVVVALDSIKDSNPELITPELITELFTTLQDKEATARMKAAYALGSIQASSPKVITGLLTALNDKETGVRESAAYALGSIQASSPEVITGLLTALKDKEADVRMSAALALGKIKVSSTEDSSLEVITGLLTTLKDATSDVRMNATYALGIIKVSSPEVIAGLLTALNDKESQVRSNAAYALGSIKASSPEVITGLLTALNDKESQVRCSVALVLGTIKVSSPEVITGLRTALNDSTLFVRKNATDALVKIGTPEAITGLVTALQNKYEDVRCSVAEALGSLKVSSPEVIKGLITALQDESSQVSCEAIKALGLLKVSSPEVIKGLTTALQDICASVRQSAAYVLVKIGTPEVITGFFTALQNKEPLVRRSAVEALDKIKVSSPEVITSLLTIFLGKDKNVMADRLSITGLLTDLQYKMPFVRERAAYELAKIKVGSPEIISGLLTVLQDKASDVRASAVLALGSIKVSSPEVITGLLIALQDKVSFVRWSAAEALGLIKVSSPEVITSLLTALQDEESQVRCKAASALGSIQASSREVITVLLTALQDVASEVRQSAAYALGSIKVSNPKVITALVTALQDSVCGVRWRAASALGLIKLSSPEVITGLVTVLEDSVWGVRWNAASALGLIKFSSPEVITGLVTALQKDNELAPRKALAKALREVMHDDLHSITPEIITDLFNFFKGTQENADVRSSLADALDKMKNHLSATQLQQLGDYYYQRLDYEKSAGNYSRLLKLTKDKRDPEAYAVLLARTIEAYLKIEELDNPYKVEDYFFEARLMFNELEKKPLRNEETQLLFTDLLANIGYFYFKALNYPLAERYFKLALAKLGTIPNKGGKVEYLNILHKQGLLALRQGNTAEALKKFQKAQAHYNQLEKTEKAIRTYMGICEGMINSYLEINELDKAYDLCNEVIEMIRSLGGTSLASFDNSIEMAINMMRLQLAAAKDPKKKELVGCQLKQLLYNPEEAQRVPELREALDRRDTFKPAIIQALIDCYSEIDTAEADKWIKEGNIKETKEGDGLEPKAAYYTQTTLLNIMSVNKNVQDGSINVNLSSRGKKALSKELWENLNESERKEIKYAPEAQYLNLESLTTKSQEAIKDLIQANIAEAVQYVYDQAKGGNVTGIDAIIGTVAATVTKGIIKTQSDQVKEQNTYLLRKEDVLDRPYSKTADLEKLFREFCNEFEERLHTLPKEGQERERIEWAKKTCAWVEYRINLTDHFYGDQSDKVAGVLVTYVCALAKTNMPVFLSRRDYFKGAPNTIREENSREDEQSLQFAEWQHHYSHRFPSSIFSPDKKAKALTVSSGKGAEMLEKTVDYYVAEANQNLERVSKLVGTGTLSTASYGAKKAAMKEEYSIDLLSSKIEADFTQEMQRLYKEKDRPFESDEALGAFVKGVAYNLLKSNIKIEGQRKDLDIFREEESGGEWWRIQSNFDAFIKELRELLPKVESGDISAKYLGALIHYRVSMTGRFFKDGNRRIALALETFVMMRNNHPLPAFYNEEDWKIAAPVKFKGEESLAYRNDLQEDARFLKWYYKYSGLFGAKEEWKPNVAKIEPKDPWKVMAAGALTRALEQHYTIYNKAHIFQDPNLLMAYVEKTGIEVKKLVAFRPERVLLHEAIAAVITNIALPAGDEEGLVLKGIVKKVCANIEKTAAFQDFAKEMPERYETFKGIALRKIKRNVHVGSQDQYATLINKYTDLLGRHYAASKKRMRVEAEEAVLADLIAWELLKREYQIDIEEMVSKEMMALKKEEGKVVADLRKEQYTLEFLKMKTGYERDIWVLAGGPASGKTSIFNKAVKQHLIKKPTWESTWENDKPDEGNIDACNINPDIFKPLLLTLGEDYHAARTHEESSYIKDLVLKKLEQTLDKTEKAPSMVLDVVNPDLKKFAAILKDNPKINLYTTTCPVTDDEEIKIYGSITRAFWRASKEFNDKGEKNPDYGRYVPSTVVLDGHKKVSEGFPGFVSSGRYSIIELHDNTTRESRKVCHLEGKALRIDNFNSFIEFLKKRHINTQAHSKETVYSSEYVDKGTFKSEHIANSVAEYLKGGIKMNYQQYMNWDNGLRSNNLGASLCDLAKDLNDKQRANSVFEAFIIDILKRHNLKGEFPIKLKEGEEAGEKEVSIFSNEIEKEGYLAKGSVFRFLRPVNNSILKEKGVNLSDDVLDKVSREVLKMMLAKRLPREEEKLIKYLPQLIETALYTANK